MARRPPSKNNCGHCKSFVGFKDDESQDGMVGDVIINGGCIHPKHLSPEGLGFMFLNSNLGPCDRFEPIHAKGND